MKQFELYGKTIQISKSREEYNRYRRRFLQMAMQSRLAFQNAYQKNQSLDDVVKNGPEQMQACVQPAIDYCLQQLVDKGVLTYDAERLEEEFQISDVWGSAYLKVYDQFAEIAMNEEELNQYRTARRQNRGRWVGGGFGVEGAIRGATTAGAMNIVTGAGHMIFNGIGSIMTSVSSDHKRKKIFQNPETYQVLENGVSGAVFMLHYVLIECLQQNGVTSLPCDGIVSDQESREATAILRNISKINKDNAAVNALLDALNKDPYNLEWYRTALQYFGDADHTLESIADHFCILNLRQEKADQLEAFAESFSLETEENANKALKEVKQEKKRLGYAQDTPTVEKIRQAVTDFDTAFRTVDGILHNSRKEAELSRSELDQLQVIEQNLDTENLQSLDQAEQAMGKLSSVVAKQHKEALQTEKNNLIVRLRTVDLQIPSSSGYLCQTIEDAQALAPLVEEIVQALSACNDSEDPTASLTALQEEISGKPVPDGIKDCYQAEIVARLHAIEAAPRTCLLYTSDAADD